MSNTSEKIFSCRGICWIVGALMGLVAAILIKGVWGLLVGIAVAVALALVLQRLFCVGHAASATAGAATTAAGVQSTPEPLRGVERDDAEAALAEDTAAAETDLRGVARDDAEAALAEQAPEAEAEPRGVALDDAEAALAEVPEPAADETADLRGVARDDAEAALAEVPEPTTTDYDGDGVLEGEGEGTRPEMLSAPRGGTADDLKLIKGIGPKLEQLCNELGFFHWDQIAGWSADEVAWVNANLKGFKGRVTRDNWVEQAKVLAAGGTTEFAQRAEKSGLYDDKG